jgi:capsular exopolysaccharide synthesis family protein
VNLHAPPSPSTDRAEQPLAFLWQGRWLVLAGALLAGGLGFVYAQVRGTVWRAQSVIFVARTSPLDRAGDAAGAQFLPRNYANTQAELLRSTPVLAAALERPGLRDNPVFQEPGNELAWLKRKLSADVGNQDDLITVTLDSPLREAACDVVNAVVDSYRAIQAGNEQGTDAVVLARLRGELERCEADLQARQDELVEFMKANPGVRLHTDTDVGADQLRQLYAALTQAGIDALEAKATWRCAAQLAHDPELLRRIPMLDSGDVIAPRGESAEARQLEALRSLRLQLLSDASASTAARFRELQARRIQLLSQVSPQHPAVAEVERDLAALKRGEPAGDAVSGLQQDIDLLERSVSEGEAQFAAAYVSALEQRYHSAVERQDDLQREITEREAALVDLEPRQTACRLLETKLDRARKLADLLYERISELDVDDQAGDLQTSATDSLIFEYATPEGAVVASSKSAVVAVSILLGALLGALAAWTRALVDQRLRTAEDLAPLLPVLASVPRFTPSPEGAVASWTASPEFADAMRSLRMALSSGARGQRSKVIQVGSPESDDGKSLVTAGLGIAMAQAGQRTLVVDADFHRPAQARLFGLSGEEGLSQLLQSGVSAVSPLATEVEGLSVLPSGPLPRNLDELLGGPRLGAALKELARRYDCIVIDSPPLLMNTDGQAVATSCGETLLVIRSGQTTRRLAQAALRAIVSVGGHVSGGVLNRVPRAAIPGSPGRYAYGAPQHGADTLVLAE